jgi:hypothetical protein
MDKLQLHSDFLCEVASTKKRSAGRDLIKKAKPKELDVICEIILNILSGTVPLAKDLLKRAKTYKTVLRKIAKKCLKKVLRKKLFIKYYTIIRRLLAAVLPICGLIASIAT